MVPGHRDPPSPASYGAVWVERQEHLLFHTVGLSGEEADSPSPAIKKPMLSQEL